jgi:hypothetical protein
MGGFEVIFNGITCLPNFMEIHQSVQTLLVDGHTETHTGRQDGDLISILSFLESILKMDP